MNKDGFTLVEILLVVALVAVISVSSVVVFDQTNKATNEEKIASNYVEIQRAAKMYIDLNDSWVNTFNKNKVIHIKLGELESTNYIARNMKNPVTGEPLDESLVIKLYITNGGTGYIDSCIVRYISTSSEECIADNEGKASGACCNK